MSYPLPTTYSILHLLAIAMDRYWAVTNVDYIHQRNAKRIGIMILTIWFVAAIIALAPNFGWKDEDFTNRIEVEKRCLVSQNIGYQIFATVATFYAPLIFILVLYWKIYQVFTNNQIFLLYLLDCLISLYHRIPQVKIEKFFKLIIEH